MLQNGGELDIISGIGLGGKSYEWLERGFSSNFYGICTEKRRPTIAWIVGIGSAILFQLRL
jgi:hypothetical protein